MIVETTSADFRRAITLAGKVVEKRTTIPMLSMVRCHANGAFEATGTDLDMTITAKVARTPGVTADFVMKSHRPVIDAIGAAGDKAVSLRHAEGKVTVASGALSMVVDTLPADEFPLDHLRDLHEQFSATLSASDIAAIARVAGAMSSEETRYYLNGINLRSISPNVIQARATDGHRLYMADLMLPDAVGTLGDNVILPRKAVRLLLDLAKSAKDGVRLVIGSPAPANRDEGTAPERPGAPRMRVSLAERAAEVQLTSKLIDGTYPDCDRVIPQGGDKQALLKVADLRRAIAAVSGHSRDVRAVKVTLDKPGQATLAAAYVAIGLSASITVPCEHNCKGFEIGLNGGYLASLLNANAGDEIVLTMSDPAAPVLARNPADTAWTAVVMPMRY